MNKADIKKAIEERRNFIDIETGTRWRINGKLKEWKRNPERFQLPVKHGLWDYGYITDDNINSVKLE